MGPNELSWMEAALQMLTPAGLSPNEAYHAFLAVIGHVRAQAMFEQDERQVSAAIEPRLGRNFGLGHGQVSFRL
jgi:hypothetical protein